MKLIRIFMGAMFLLGLTANAMAVERIGVGETIRIGDVGVTLNKIVPAGKDSLGGEGFTEYNLTVKNGSASKEVVLANVAMAINGETRYMVKNPDEIVRQGNSQGKDAATEAGAGAVGAIGGMFGVLGSIGSQMLTNHAVNKIYVDDPQKWRDELKKRGFQRDADGISVFPSEAATGSIWVKQSGSETAKRMQLYLKEGGSSKLVKLELAN